MVTLGDAPPPQRPLLLPLNPLALCSCQRMATAPAWPCARDDTRRARRTGTGRALSGFSHSPTDGDDFRPFIPGVILPHSFTRTGFGELPLKSPHLPPVALPAPPDRTGQGNKG